MENSLLKTIERAKYHIKNWWILLIVGIVFIALGIFVFCHPIASIMALSLFFGIAMLISGCSQLILATSGNFFTTRGWLIVGAVLDILLGILLTCNLDVTEAMLPYLLAFWIMYHGFMIIGLGSDLNTFRVKGYGWYVFGGLLFIVLAVLVMIHPILGESIIVLLLGLAFCLIGIAACLLSFHLKNIHKKVKDFVQDVNGEEIK